MDLEFLYNNNTIHTVTSTNHETITFDNSYFYVEVNGNPNRIDCIEGESVSSGESLTIVADGTGAGYDWHIETVTHTYSKNGVTDIPESAATWSEVATNKLELEVKGPNAVDQVAKWDFDGPSLPPAPLKIRIKRKS